MRKLLVLVLSFVTTIACAQVMVARSRLNHFPNAAHAYWDVTQKYVNINVSGRGLIASYVGTAGNHFVRSTNAIPALSKRYFEIVFQNNFTGGVGGNEGQGGGVIDGAVVPSAGAACYATTAGLAIYATDGKAYSVTSQGAASWTSNRVAVEVDSTTRNVWMCDPANTSTCIKGGNPVTGTTPTKTLTGSGSIYACGDPENQFLSGIQSQVVLVSDPAQMVGTPPTGFTAGF